MHKLRALIPSSNHLFAFEAAGRLLSFTDAAAELNVTQPAISKTIRSLEQACGIQLFRRGNGRLSLTPEGQRLFVETRGALDRLHEVIVSLQESQHMDLVRASFSSVFVALWLLPRLPKFNRAHPGIRLRIEESSQDVFDLEREDVDISGRLGYGDWPNLEATPFLREEIQPVCSPSYLEAHGPLTRPADLLDQELLHFEERHRKRVNWDTWMAAHGLAGVRLPRNLVFTDNLASTQAAVLGQGVALSWTHLVDDHMSQGRLVNPLGTKFYTDKTMFLVTPAARPVSPGTRIFRDWLVQEIRTMPQVCV